MKYQRILIILMSAISVGHAIADEGQDDQIAAPYGSYEQEPVNTTDNNFDEIKHYENLLKTIDSIYADLVNVEMIANEILVSIPQTGDLSTREKIQEEIEKMDSYKNGYLKSKDEEINKIYSNAIKNKKSIDEDVKIAVSRIGDSNNSEKEALLIKIHEKNDGINEKVESINHFSSGIMEKIGAIYGSYKDAERNIAFAEQQEIERKQLELAKEAKKKKVEELRGHANLNEEEYIVPIFSCRVKDAMWCFSTSHKVYAITGYVSVDDTNKMNAAIYQEVGQGEVQDYTKEAASAVAAYGWIENIGVSGTRNLPHVYMTRDRR